jgi:hypothetical protein
MSKMAREKGSRHRLGGTKEEIDIKRSKFNEKLAGAGVSNEWRLRKKRRSRFRAKKKFSPDSGFGTR